MTTPQMPKLSEITPSETFPFLATMETFKEERTLAAALMTVTPGPRRTSPMMPERHKFCPCCRAVKPFAEFYVDRSKGTRRRSYCRACDIKRLSEYRAMRNRDQAAVRAMTVLLSKQERYESEVA